MGGQIDHQVVIHGDVVNYRVPGTYKIRFDCEDSSGNDADQLTRTVVIEDTVCPYVKLAGHNTQTVEAGFPYEDVGATATDTLDGDLTSNLKISDGPFRRPLQQRTLLRRYQVPCPRCQVWQLQHPCYHQRPPPVPPRVLRHDQQGHFLHPQGTPHLPR